MITYDENKWGNKKFSFEVEKTKSEKNKVKYDRLPKQKQ